MEKAVLKKNTKGEAQPELTPEAMEGLLREIVAMAGLRDLDAEDMKALTASLDESSPTDGLSVDEEGVKVEAQELAWAAMEAGTEKQSRKLAKLALELDPDCVDALLVVVDLDCITEAQRIEGLRKAVKAGERSLGTKFFRENEGKFWLRRETRPYMRAMDSLAFELAEAGQQQGAVKVYERMLLLNPNDNQGARYELLGLYLAMGEVAWANRLLRRYKTEASATFAWAKVIARFADDDIDGAEAALREAIMTNRFVALHLAGLESLPDDMPDFYAPGSADEAVLCHEYLEAAWVVHKKALFWVYDQLTQIGLRRARTELS